MTGFLTRLAARSLATAPTPPQGAAQLVVPRPMSLFEPAGGRRVELGPVLDPAMPEVAVELDRSPIEPSLPALDDRADRAADDPPPAPAAAPPPAPRATAAGRDRPDRERADRSAPDGAVDERPEPALEKVAPRPPDASAARGPEAVATVPHAAHDAAEPVPAVPARAVQAPPPPPPPPPPADRRRPPTRRGDQRPRPVRPAASGSQAVPQPPAMARPPQRPRLAAAGARVRAREAERVTEPASDRVVHVSIGRVDIRAAPAPPDPRRAPAAAARAPAMSLSDYLERRDREAGR